MTLELHALPLILAEAAPLAGRLAFAGVFVALILWLLVIPRGRLAEEMGADGNPKPVWRQARTWAIGVASLQLLVYLFWK